MNSSLLQALCPDESTVEQRRSYSSFSLDKLEGDSDNSTSEVSTSHICCDFGLFPMYVPEHSYTSSPAPSPPPQIHPDDMENEGLEIDLSPNLYTPHLSVIEEECDSICISHTDPLQHLKDHLTIINDEVTEMERSLFIKKRMFSLSLLNHSLPNINNPTKSSRFLHPLHKAKSIEVSRSGDYQKTSPQVISDPSAVSESLLEKLQNYQNTLLDLMDFVEFHKSSNASSVQDIEENINSLRHRLNFLQRIVRQNLSETDAVICLGDTWNTAESVDTVNTVNTVGNESSDIVSDNSVRHNPICSPSSSSSYEEYLLFCLFISSREPDKCCPFSCAIC